MPYNRPLCCIQLIMKREIGVKLGVYLGGDKKVSSFFEYLKEL